MNISKISVKRPVTVLMMTFMAIILGLVSLSEIPVDLLPKIEVPVAIVSTSYTGVGPREVEKLITIPMEESIATVGNLENLTSISSEGSSIVIAEFSFGTDMDFATLEMREKIDLIKGILPEDSNNPLVLRIDPNAFPIMEVTLSGSDDLAELQSFAEDTIKPRLERLEGVASVDISGGYEKEVKIELNEEKARGYKLTTGYISQILSAENLNLPGGEVKKGDKKLSLRITGEFESLEDIRMLPVKLPTGGSVKLYEVADVNIGFKEESSRARLNGNPSINISISKQPGKNTVKVAQTITSEIEDIKAEYPIREIQIVIDQSEYINVSITNLVDSALLGAVFAILVLYVFFRNIRTTFIISTAIPVSMIVTFVLVYFSNVTLNLMTLGGLALGVGMLVDNAIVVLENIYRYGQEGKSRKEASVCGAKEVSMAVTASTLTTVAVFLPIVFVEGITSTIFRELALTISLSLFASLIVSLTLIPMLASKILKVDMEIGKHHHRRFKIFSKFYDLFDSIFFKIRGTYGKILAWSLKHRKSTVLIGLLIFALAMATIGQVGAEFFPEFDEGQFRVDISLPDGSELEETDLVIKEIEEKIKNIEEVDRIFVSVGSTGNRFSIGNARSIGNISVILVPLEERNRATSKVADEVRSMLKNKAGIESSVSIVSTMMGGGGGGAGFGGPAISISVKGEDIEVLKKIGEDFKEEISKVEGTREIESSLEDGISEVRVKIDKKRASLYGINSFEISNSLKGVITGNVATRYKLEGDELDVTVKGDEVFASSIENLKRAPIPYSQGTIPLERVADVIIEDGPISIDRDNQSRVVTITGQIIGRDLRSVDKDIKEKLKGYQMPRGYIYKVGGQSEELISAFSDLFQAMALAVILVYMILASQFESLLHPFTIMLCVPLSISGGVFGLFITNRTLSVPSMIGGIMLAGIVVNDAIVLIDYTNTRRKMGEDKNTAILKAGETRLRPIMITTLTTVLGLMPLVIGLGEGSEALAPMATVVVFGLSLATLLTLVFIPVVYSIFEDISEFFKRKIYKKEKIA